jgi:hypothetical protein
MRLVAASMGLNLFERVQRVISFVLGVGKLGALGVGVAHLLLGETVGNTLFNAPSLAAVSGFIAGWIIVVTLHGLLSEIFRGFHDIRLTTILGCQMTGTMSGGLATMGLVVISLFLLWLVQGRTTLATVLLLAICSGAISALLAGSLLHRKIAGVPVNLSDKSREIDFTKVLGEVFSVAWPPLITGIVMFGLRYGGYLGVGGFRITGRIRHLWSGAPLGVCGNNAAGDHLWFRAAVTC